MATRSEIRLKFNLGQDNLSPETQLPLGAARELANFDVFPSGTVRTRPGLRLITAGLFHSLYRPTHGKFSLCWKDGALCRLDGTTITVLQQLANRPIVFANLNGETFWTNGETVGRVKIDGTASFWGLPLPVSPQATAVSTGGLKVGTYQVAMTAVVDGIESGANIPTVVKVAEGGGISVSVPTGATFNVYVTPPNGSIDELRQAAVVPSGGSIQIGSGIFKRILKGLLARKPVPGQAIAEYKGRLFVASGSTVWFTEAMAPHWLQPEFGYFRFSGTVNMLGVAEDGLYVGTANQAIYFLSGTDPRKMIVSLVSLIGSASTAIPLSPIAFGGNNQSIGRQCAWVDSDGYLCVGKPGGLIIRPHRERFCMGNLQGITLTEIEHDGLRQVVIGFSGCEDGAIPIDDAAIAEVFSYGLILGA